MSSCRLPPGGWLAEAFCAVACEPLWAGAGSSWQGRAASRSLRRCGGVSGCFFLRFRGTRAASRGPVGLRVVGTGPGREGPRGPRRVWRMRAGRRRRSSLVSHWMGSRSRPGISWVRRWWSRCLPGTDRSAGARAWPSRSGQRGRPVWGSSVCTPPEIKAIKDDEQAMALYRQFNESTYSR